MVPLSVVAPLPSSQTFAWLSLSTSTWLMWDSSGQSAINVGGVVLRTSEAGRIWGIQMQTFFGGTKLLLNILHIYFLQVRALNSLHQRTKSRTFPTSPLPSPRDFRQDDWHHTHTTNHSLTAITTDTRWPMLCYTSFPYHRFSTTLHLDVSFCFLCFLLNAFCHVSNDPHTYTSTVQTFVVCEFHRQHAYDLWSRESILTSL